MRGNGGGVVKNLQRGDSAAAFVPEYINRRDPGISSGAKTGWGFPEPGQRKTAFLTQLCLSQGAGVSIILPTLPRKPWYCFPNDLGTQLQPLERLSFSASECLKIGFHFRISQEH